MTPREVRANEGLPVVRLAMIVSSLAPLFLLWAVRGIKPLSDCWVVSVCITLIAIPYAILGTRIVIARRRHDMHVLSVGVADDHRDHLLVYLFAMLIPLFDANVGTPRDSVATIVALLLVIFLFWHLNLHYMNILFAILGYHVFTVRSDAEANQLVVLARRDHLSPGSKVRAYRLSNTVYIER